LCSNNPEEGRQLAGFIIVRLLSLAMASLSAPEMNDLTDQIQPEGAQAERNPKGLLLEKIKAEKHWDAWSSDEELDTSNCAAFSAGVSATDNPASSKRARWADVVEEAASDEVSLLERWLLEVSPLLSKYDGVLLRRYMPSLPTASLQEVVTASRTEYSAFMASKKEEPQPQISKMAMRRVLATTFERLAPADAYIREVHRQWEATKDKSDRKSKASTQSSTMQWHQRRQNRYW